MLLRVDNETNSNDNTKSSASTKRKSPFWGDLVLLSQYWAIIMLTDINLLYLYKSNAYGRRAFSYRPCRLYRRVFHQAS